MTTMERTGLHIAEACRTAGVNGVIRRSGHAFVVGQTDPFAENDWTLSPHNGGPAEPYQTYLSDNWTVVSTAGDEPVDEVETETVYTFFANIQPWTFVAKHGISTEYLYGGITIDDNGNDEVVLLHTRYFNDATISQATLQEDNDGWHVVEVDETPKVASQLERQLVRQLRGARYEIAQNAEVTRQALSEVNDVRRDFATVNEKINEYANDQGMCSDYERRIFRWNRDLKVVKLSGREGRDFSFQVPVRIPQLTADTVYVSVPGCTSPEEARERAQGYSSMELLSELAKSGAYMEFTADWCEDEEVMF